MAQVRIEIQMWIQFIPPFQFLLTYSPNKIVVYFDIMFNNRNFPRIRKTATVTSVHPNQPLLSYTQVLLNSFDLILQRIKWIFQIPKLSPQNANTRNVSTVSQ